MLHQKKCCGSGNLLIWVFKTHPYTSPSNIKIVFIFNSGHFGFIGRCPLLFWHFLFWWSLTNKCLSCFIIYCQKLYSTDQIYFANKLNSMESLFKKHVFFGTLPASDILLARTHLAFHSLLASTHPNIIGQMSGKYMFSDIWPARKWKI